MAVLKKRQGSITSLSYFDAIEKQNML